MVEKFIENLALAEKIIQTADNMIYITFPLVKDKRILLKILSEIKSAIVICIGSILHYEYACGRVTLYKDPKSNFRTFSEKCALRYGINKLEIKSILELFDFVEKHTESPFEFMKGDKIFILSSDLRQKTLTLEETKEFLILSKNIIKKIKENFLRKI